MEKNKKEKTLQKEFEKIIDEVKKDRSSLEYYANDDGLPKNCDDQFIGKIEISLDRNLEGKIKWITPIEKIKDRT